MNEKQIEFWNGNAGEKWVRHADQLDSLLSPFADDVLARADLSSGEHVLDVGCGAGAMTLRAAEIVGPAHGATGADISAPLIELARKRATERGAPARFEQADASLFRAAEPVDALISRFGVMFFEDPVSAFANLRGSVRPEGRMVFACWQSLAKNDWARAPLDVIVPMMSQPPEPPPPHAPGPFAFADKDRLADILKQAGWQSISIESWSNPLRLPGDTASEAAAFMMEIGPTSRLIANADLNPGIVSEALIASLETDKNGNGVSLPAAAWIVSATAT